MRNVWLTSALMTLVPLLAPGMAQAPAGERFVGTVSGFSPETAEITVKPDRAEAVRVKAGLDTLVQQVAPGEKDLKNARTIAVTDLAVGDRVYVTLVPGTLNARRIVVMSAREIAGRQEAERQDWIRRGVAGIVAAKTADTITLRMRSFMGERTATVKVGPKTLFRRYAPDSVRFADARPSEITAVAPGDQLRARGEKSADGAGVTAEEVVFGTFVTHAGSITAVNLPAGEVTVKDLVTNQPLVIKLAADSQLKMMPDLPPMMAGGGPPRLNGGPPRGNGGPPDFSQMLERMPAAKPEDLTPGMSIVVSSTKGSREGKITAIMLLAKADMLIRMATMGSGRRNRPEAANGTGMSGMGMGMGGMNGGLGGLELPGMIP